MTPVVIGTFDAVADAFYRCACFYFFPHANDIGDKLRIGIGIFNIKFSGNIVLRDKHFRAINGIFQVKHAPAGKFMDPFAFFINDGCGSF
ncbi:hypothetical protein Xekj_04293 [Xenorhabdus sp. KJ12.1]|nr:hypothetical protein Xekj_04293 [Xenorhabdus sp. KJ12.1]